MRIFRRYSTFAVAIGEFWRIISIFTALIVGVDKLARTQDRDWLGYDEESTL